MLEGRLPCALAVALGAFFAGEAPPAGAAARLDPRYLELVRLYARGDRPEAVTRLGEWKVSPLRRQLGIVESAILAREKCPECPDPLAGIPLRAAVMLHADRDRVERPKASGREQIPACPGPHGSLAEGFASALVRKSETRDFARRFFIATADRFQLDACFDDAYARARAGLELFPRDAELLLAKGSVREEYATLPLEGDPGRTDPRAAGWLKEARRDFADAVAADPTLALARIRLGRVHWRLGRMDDAREALESALSLAGPGSPELYLTHLFLGRVHQDAGRFPEAVSEYREALAVDPVAQSAAIALAHVLQLQGEPGEARNVLARGLLPRQTRDAFWDYLVANAWHTEELLEALRRETLE